MVIGWRRAFCTSIPKEKKDSQTQSSTTTTTSNNNNINNPSPRFSNKFNFFFSSSSSNSAPSTPRLKSQPSTGLRCRTTANTPNSSQPNSPKLHCKTSITTSSSSSSPRLFFQQSNLINNNNNNNNNKQQLRLRVYNDDEPLMCSPISLAHFNPIPESEEESNDDDNDIRTQGFFLVATPATSSSIKQQQQQSVLISLLPDSAVVSINRSYETHVLLMRIKSPPPAATARGATRGRVPVDLVAVLDASENMSGWRLQIMKRALKLVISSLGSTDRLSVVAFSSSSKRLLPLKRMSGDGRRSARRIVDALGCTGQGMNLNDAVKKAVKVLEDRRERNNVSRIIVLSDGHNLTINSNNNNNSCSVFPLVTTTRSTQLDIPIHIVGFGNINGYNHHAPAEDVIAKRVAALLRVVVKDLKVQIRVGSGQVAAVYSVSGKPSYLGSGSGSLLIGDMYAEEERELMIELRVPTPNSSNGPHHDSSLTVRSTMREPLSHELIHSKEQNLLLPHPHHAVRSSSSSPSKIIRLKNFHVSTRAVAESRRLIEHDDLSGAYHLLTSARTLLVKSAGDGGSGEEFLATVEAELAEVQQMRNRVRQRIESSSLLHEKPTVAGDQLTPTSAWRAAERLAKLAIMRKHMNRVSDLHGFENARF